MNKKKIRTFLNSHKRLDYIQRVVRYFFNDEMFETVLDINASPRLLKFEHLGDECIGENLYYIFLKGNDQGFFSLVCNVLDALRFADKYHFIPYVEWGKNCLYAEQNAINGSVNPFEYYYCPVSLVTKDQAVKGDNVIRYRPYHRNINRYEKFQVASYTMVQRGEYDKYIEENAKVYGKYIKLNPCVEEYINKNIQDVLDNDVITVGVHVRGTDFNKGYVNHAKVVTVDQYIEATKNITEKIGAKKIFLATDEEKTIFKFNKVFGDMVITYSDVLRSSDGEAVHFSNSSRKNHHYLLGLEVLRDMYTLSSCDALIAGYSNVSLMAQIVNRCSAKQYKYVKLLNNGFNMSGKSCLEDRKKDIR